MAPFPLLADELAHVMRHVPAPRRLALSRELRGVSRQACALATPLMPPLQRARRQRGDRKSVV